MAWAFTRLSSKGVWRYLENVDEVNCPRFSFVHTENNNLKQNDYEKTTTITRDDNVDAAEEDLFENEVYHIVSRYNEYRLPFL